MVVRTGSLPIRIHEQVFCLISTLSSASAFTVSSSIQQSHCGIYKTLNAGDDWIDIQQTLPSEFGFPIAIDTHHPDTVFVVVEDPYGRQNVGEHFSVYRTRNGGESWEPLTDGLPAGQGVRLGVLRHSMCTDAQDPCGVYVGTNTGQIFASRNSGDSWNLIADFLPSINSVTAT